MESMRPSINMFGPGLQLKPISIVMGMSKASHLHYRHHHQNPVIELTVNFIVVFIGVPRLIILFRDPPPTRTRTCLLWLSKPLAEPVLDNHGDIGAVALIQFLD